MGGRWLVSWKVRSRQYGRGFKVDQTSKMEAVQV